jgi:hypothetical protein
LYHISYRDFVLSSSAAATDLPRILTIDRYKIQHKEHGTTGSGHSQLFKYMYNNFKMLNISDIEYKAIKIYVINICVAGFRHILPNQNVDLEKNCRKFSRSHAKTTSPRFLPPWNIPRVKFLSFEVFESSACRHDSLICFYCVWFHICFGLPLFLLSAGTRSKVKRGGRCPYHSTNIFMSYLSTLICQNFCFYFNLISNCIILELNLKHLPYTSPLETYLLYWQFPVHKLIWE